MAALEAQASGRPVIAFGAGGALETVVHGHTGALFREQSLDCLVATLSAFDPDAFDSAVIRAHAERFSEAAFRRGVLRVVCESGAPSAVWKGSCAPAGRGGADADAQVLDERMASW
jgi:glycosyltransferase involved in cell wall biosynthesis